MRELYWKFHTANEIAEHIARVDFVSKIIMAFIPRNSPGGTLATIVEARRKLEYDERVQEQ